MKLSVTENFRIEYQRLPQVIQDQVDEKLEIFLKNERYPSLRVKKMEGTNGIWELRVNQNYRITFSRGADIYVLRRVGTHNVLRRP